MKNRITVEPYPPAPARAAVPCLAMAASASEHGVVTTYPDGSFTLEPYGGSAAPERAVVPQTILHSINPNAGIVPAYPKGRWTR